MWAESGATTNVGTVSSADLANAVVRAIERNRAEINVAPWSVRIGGVLAHIAPMTLAQLAERSSADRQTAALAAGLRHKR